MQNRTGVIARNYSGLERDYLARESSMESRLRVINPEIGSRRETKLSGYSALQDSWHWYSAALLKIVSSKRSDLRNLSS